MTADSPVPTAIHTLCKAVVARRYISMDVVIQEEKKALLQKLRQAPEQPALPSVSAAQQSQPLSTALQAADLPPSAAGATAVHNSTGMLEDRRGSNQGDRPILKSSIALPNHTLI